jgi:hypothetical protein
MRLASARGWRTGVTVPWRGDLERCERRAGWTPPGPGTRREQEVALPPARWIWYVLVRLQLVAVGAGFESWILDGLRPSDRLELARFAGFLVPVRLPIIPRRFQHQFLRCLATGNDYSLPPSLPLATVLPVSRWPASPMLRAGAFR